MSNAQEINPLTIDQRKAIVAIFDGASSTEDLAHILGVVAYQVQRNGEDYAVTMQLARDIHKAIGRAVKA